MKNFFLGFLTTLVLVGLVCGVYYFVWGRERGKTIEQAPPSQDDRIVVEDSGALNVTVLYQGKPAKNVEVDLGAQPGADDYHQVFTDDNGLAFFEDVPAGNYVIYFNSMNFPPEYGEPYAVIPVEIIKNQKTEKIIELTESY